MSNSLSGHERNHLFANHRGTQFADIAGVSGLDDAGDGRVSVVFDYDRDGWQDIALVNANAPLLQLFRSQIGDGSIAHKGGFIAFRLTGGNQEANANNGWSCRDGYGASIEVTLGDGQKLYREHRCGDGFASQNSATLLVGIGGQKEARHIAVRWPSGRRQSIENVAEGTLVTVYENPKRSPSGEAFIQENYRRKLPPQRGPIDPAGPTRLAWATAAPGQLCVSTTTATWCAACRKELPQFEVLRKTFAESELKLVGVPIDPKDTDENLDVYLKEHQPAYRLERNLSEDQLAELDLLVIDELGLSGLPASVVTRDDGTILEVSWGVPSISRIRELMKEQQRCFD